MSDILKGKELIDQTVTENKLSQELQDKINSGSIGEYVINGWNNKQLQISSPGILINGGPIALGSVLENTEVALEGKEISLHTTGIAKYKGNEIATVEDIITKTDGDGTKYLADDGSYKEVSGAEGNYVVNGVNPSKVQITAPTDSGGVTINTAPGSLDSITLAVGGGSSTSKGSIEINTSNIMIHSHAGLYLGSTTGGVSINSLAQMIHIEGRGLTWKNSEFNMDFINGGNPGNITFTTGLNGKMLYNNVEVATQNDIITKTDGDGTKYLSDDGTYKGISGPEGNYVINGNTNGNILIGSLENITLLSTGPDGINLSTSLGTTAKYNGNEIATKVDLEAIILPGIADDSDDIENIYVKTVSGEMKEISLQRLKQLLESI